MPPPATKKQLSADDKELLRRWLAEGAEYQPHWSLIAPVRPALPAVKNTAWRRNPIDDFVLAQLEQEGLQPAPEADRRTLARRLSLDLTGLPPEPALVEAFVNDGAADAYEKVVDELMSSAKWGEHRGRYWLDAARYADTHGIHFDNYREIWPYRDWVINAFNRNLPFDQFTIEQLAGDLLPNRTLQQQIGSGFNRCNITTNEGGVIPEEYVVLYARDRTETTAQVWMGLTAGCAVCHDHKFDRFSQREFYELSAFFNNTTQNAMDGNIKDTPPTIFVPRPEDRQRWAASSTELAGFKKQLDERRAGGPRRFRPLARRRHARALNGRIPSDGLRLHAGLSEGSGNTINVTVGGQVRPVSLASEIAWKPGRIAAQAYNSQPGCTIELPDAGDFEKDQAFSFGAWVNAAKIDQSGAIMARMDDANGYRGWDFWFEDGKPGMHIIHQWPDDALKVVATNPVKASEWNHLFITYDGSGKASGVKIYVNGELQPARPQADKLKSTIKTTVPFKVAQRHAGSRLNDVSIQDLRLYGRALPQAEAMQLVQASRRGMAGCQAGGPAQRGGEE